MTETIGWGDVEVDLAPSRRRRLRRGLLWAVLLAVVAGVAVVPSARARLAGNSAAWLARAWTIAQAYDARRTTAEEQALQRVGAGASDADVYARIVSLLDREEASRLRALGHAVGGRLSWARDVHDAAVAVRRTLVAEAQDLDADAGRTSETFSSGAFLETPTQPATQALQGAAQRDVDRLVRRHHLRLPSHPSADSTTLRSATALLERLTRVTDRPVDLRLAILHDDVLDLWDLSTGKGRTDVAISSDTPYFTSPLIRLGGRVLMPTDDGPRMFSATGESRRLALRTPAEYFSAGDGTLWAVGDNSWRHYDGAGRPVGPAYPTLADYSGVAAAGDSLILAKAHPDLGAWALVWTPSTGRRSPVPGACEGSFTGASSAVAYVSCDQTSVSVMDVRNGRVHTVHAPEGTVVDEAGIALSPDGTRLAFRAGALNGDESASTLVLLDTRSRNQTVIARGSLPLGWSPDGSTLLISSDVGDNVYPRPLSYWMDGMARPQPIRILVAGTTVAAALLP